MPSRSSSAAGSRGCPCARPSPPARSWARPSTPSSRELPEIQSLGVEVLGVSILAIRPNPETARALEAEAREQLLKEADDAIFERRNASVDNERAIKENELRTEKAIQEKRNELEAEQCTHEIEIESSRTELVEKAAENSRTESEAKAFAVEALVDAMKAADPAVVQAMVAGGIQPDRLIANAFQELARNSDKIGNLNITPDLLSELMGGRGKEAAIPEYEED